MADISQVQVGSTTYDVHDATARTDVSNEIARAKKAESDEYTRATTAEAALRNSLPVKIRTGSKLVTTQGEGWLKVWSKSEFLKEFGCSPQGTNVIIILMNHNSGGSYIWIEPPLVNGNADVLALAVEVIDHYPKEVSSGIKIPVNYTVIIS